MPGYFDDLVPAAPAAPAVPAAPAFAPVASAPSSAPVVYDGGHGISVEVGGPQGGQDATAPDATATPAPAAAPAPAAPPALPTGLFDDLTPQPSGPHDTFWSGLGHAVMQAGRQLGADVQDASMLPAQPKDLGDALQQSWHQFTSVPRIAGDVLGVLGSPIEGAVVQPAARALDHLPWQAYSIPSLQLRNGALSIDGAHPLSEQETHDANAGAVRLGLSAMPAARGAAGLEALASANDDAVLARATGNATGSADTARATSYVSKLIKSAGSSPDDLAAAGGGSPVMAAEAIGKPAQVAVGALARREGVTGDQLAGEINQRQLTRGPRMLQAFADAAGVDPQVALGDIQSVVKKGQADAKPLYEAAYDAGPIYNQTLEKLTARPSIQEAARRAYRIAREDGEDPEALGLANVEKPDNWTSWEPPPVSAPEPPASQVGFAPQRSAGPARAPGKGPSMLKAIADDGGILDMQGEVTAMGGDKWHLGRPGQAKLIASPSRASGMFDSANHWSLQPEAVAQRLWEKGYFPGREAPPEVNELYDAMGDELRGRALYNRAADPAAQTRFERANANEELSYRGGDVEDVPHPDQYVGRPAPQDEPAQQTQPTAKTWDYVKRGLDDILAPYRAGKKAWDEEGLAADRTRQELVAKLKEANPVYRDALNTASDYLSAKQAFDDGGKMLLDHRVNESDFADRLQGMTSGQMRAFRGGIANKLYDLSQGGRFDPKVLNTPRIATKLRMALGEKRAQGLIDTAVKEAQMLGFERRYGPMANSVTMDLQHAVAEQDAPGAVRQIAGDALANVHRGPVRALLAALGRHGQRMVSTFQTEGMPLGARDEAGRMLMMSPEELAALVRTNAGGPKRSLGAGVYRGMIGSTALDEARKGGKP